MTCKSITMNGTNLQQHGSENLDDQETSQKDILTLDQYAMFPQESCGDTISAIFSQELAAGISPCVLPDTEICPAGQDHHHASPSPLPDISAEKTMNDTSHQSGLNSSKSAALQSFLASRLQTRLSTDGSMIYSMRWKIAVTPAGRQYCQLVASARRTSAKGCSSGQSGWPTPKHRDHHTEGRGQFSPSLAKVVESVAGWPTPTTRDHKDDQECPNVPTNSLLGREVWKADRPIRITASGQALTGSDAGTASSGQLNPRFSGWLMGYPTEWCEAALSAHHTRSPKNRKRGS